MNNMFSHKHLRCSRGCPASRVRTPIGMAYENTMKPSTDKAAMMTKSRKTSKPYHHHQQFHPLTSYRKAFTVVDTTPPMAKTNPRIDVSV